MINWQYIIIQHSWSEDHSTNLDWGAIRHYHLEKGWVDVGYHFGLELVYGEPEILVGRMLTEKGAHCIGRNHDSIGICIIGNYDEHLVIPSMWVKLVNLCKWLCVSNDMVVSDIRGHHEYASYKSCPGKMFDMQKLRDDVARSIIKMSLV